MSPMILHSLAAGALPMLSTIASTTSSSSPTAVSLMTIKSFLNTSSTSFSLYETGLQSLPVVSNIFNNWGDHSALIVKCTLALCSLFYASNYMFTKDLQTTMAPSMIAFIRFFIASVCFLPHIIGYRGDIGAILGSIELGFWCGLGFIAQAYSLQFNSSGKVAFFCGLGVIMPPIFTYISNKLYATPLGSKEVSPTIAKNNIVGYKHSPRISNKLISAYQYLSREVSQLLPLPSLLALIGGAVLELGGLEAPKWSDLSLLLTPFAFSMCFWRSDQHMKKHPQDSIIVTGTLLTTTAVMCLIWTILSKAFPTTRRSALDLIQSISSKKTLYGFLYTGIISTTITSIIEQWAMKVVSASQITLIYTLEPIFATIFGVLYLHEKLNTSTILGAILIILACVADSKSNESSESSESSEIVNKVKVNPSISTYTKRQWSHANNNKHKW